MDKKFGWFTTGRDREAINLLELIYNGTKEGKIDGRISYIFMNREKGEGQFSDEIMQMAGGWKIPLVCFSSSAFRPELRRKGHTSEEAMAEWREEYHQEVINRLEGREAEFSILAGYMLIVGKGMCHEYPLINLHPAPPRGPAGTWQEVIWQLIRMRAQKSGVTIHRVTPELDQGSPITYCLYSIGGGCTFLEFWLDLDEKLKAASLDEIIKMEGEANPLFRMIRHAGVEREMPLLFQTISELCSGRLLLKESRVFYSGKNYKNGVCMTDVIERRIRCL